MSGRILLVLWCLGLAAAIALTPGEVATPGATSADWLRNAAEANRRATETATELDRLGPGGWAGVGLFVLGLLGAAKRYAPIVSRIVPGWGSFIELVANGLWHLASTRDQKAADHAAAIATEAAGYLVTIAQAARALPPGTLPDHIQQMAASPIVSAAIDQLSNPKA